MSLLVGLVFLLTGQQAKGQSAAEFSNWLYWYSSGDLRADFNNDQRLTPADFTAFLAFHTSPSLGGGFTDLVASSDTHKIYVSSVSGNDSRDGRTQSNAVKTITRAYQLIRDGYPDWILIKRGESYVEAFPNWKKSGRSKNEPMVVTTWGPSSLRPAILTGASDGLISTGAEVRKHLRFVGFRMEPHQRTPSDSPEGISFYGPVEDVLIEDCYVFGYDDGIVFQGADTNRSKDVRINRCISANNWAIGEHSQGFFARNLDGIKITDCVFDHNGWHPQLENETRTIFNHNVYIQRDVTGLIFTGNIVARGSSHGIQARNGGTVDRNLFYRNTISVLWGNEGNSNESPITGSVDDNLILEGVDLLDSPRGWAIHIQNVQRGTVNRNIIAKSDSFPDATWGIGIRGPNTAPVLNTEIHDNVVHNWDNGISVQDQNAVDVSIMNNRILNTRGDEPLVDHKRTETLDNVQYSNNRYFRGGNSGWFSISNSPRTINQWRSQADSGGQVVATPSQHFPNSGWSLDTYAAANGFGTVDGLLAELRSQREQQWRQSLTSRAIINNARAAYGLTSLPQ